VIEYPIMSLVEYGQCEYFDGGVCNCHGFPSGAHRPAPEPPPFLFDNRTQYCGLSRNNRSRCNGANMHYSWLEEWQYADFNKNDI
jgi:hypothetical protein